MSSSAGGASQRAQGGFDIGDDVLALARWLAFIMFQLGDLGLSRSEAKVNEALHALAAEAGNSLGAAIAQAVQLGQGTNSI